MGSAQATTHGENYSGELTESDLVIYHHAAIPHVDHVRAKRHGFGKKSGRERLTRAIRIALRRYLDDLDAGRIDPPDWNDEPRRAAR